MAHKWERTPVHLGSAPVELAIAGDPGFAALKHATELHKAGARVPFRFMDLAGSPVPIDAQWLPGAGEVSFQEYAERLRVLSQQTPFFLQLPQIHRFDSLLWQRVREFARNIYRYIGLPAGRAWSDVYIGRYNSTPFGIHLDSASNFTFGLAGKKTLYLWEPEYYERRIKGQDPRNYQPFLADAIELTVHAGEIIYWPSRYWHVAASHGDFSITANVSFYLKDSLADRIGQTITQLVRAQLGEKEVAHGYEFDPAQAQESAARLPSALQEVLNQVETIVRDGVLAQHLEIDWLARLTRYGFESGPLPVESAPLAKNSCLRGNPENPILWWRGAAEALVVSANGQLMTVPDHPQILQLLLRLNAGQPERVTALIESASGDPSFTAELHASVREMFRQLVRWGAVRVC